MKRLTPDEAPEVGCYVDGHWGWKATAHMVEQFDGVYFELTDAERELVSNHLDGDLDVESYDYEIGDLMGECERAIDDGLPDGLVAHWYDGEFFISPVCENGDCEDETCAHWCWS